MRYSLYHKTGFAKNKKESDDIYGVSKRIFVETHKDSTTTLINSYDCNDFTLSKSISFVKRADGSGYIFSADDKPLDCNNEDINKIIVTEFNYNNHNGDLIKQVVEHNGEIVFERKVERIQ